METKEINDSTPSRVLLILVKGSRESLSSRTTFVLLSKAGSILVNFIMCPGNHDGGPGRAGRWVKAIFRTRGMAECEFCNKMYLRTFLQCFGLFLSKAISLAQSNSLSVCKSTKFSSRVNTTNAPKPRRRRMLNIDFFCAYLQVLGE